MIVAHPLKVQCSVEPQSCISVTGQLKQSRAEQRTKNKHNEQTRQRKTKQKQVCISKQWKAEQSLGNTSYCEVNSTRQNQIARLATKRGKKAKQDLAVCAASTVGQVACGLSGAVRKFSVHGIVCWCSRFCVLSQPVCEQSRNLSGCS